MLYHAGMERMSLHLVRAIAACLLLASSSCTTTHEHSDGGAAGDGGKSAGGGKGGTNAGGTGGKSGGGGKGGANASGTGGTHGGSGGAPAAGSSGSDATQCETAADCAYGEIDHEILKKSDCICRFGCPYLPLSKTTIERRNASYTKLCDPAKDGQGKPCPIDDCVPLEAILCEDNTCRAAPR